jgi:hypothetical protein
MLVHIGYLKSCRNLISYLNSIDNLIRLYNVAVCQADFYPLLWT